METTEQDPEVVDSNESQPQDPTDTSPPAGSDDEQFRQEQQAAAAEQNQSGENAVPEQRPQAFLANDAPPSPLTQRLVEEGAIPSPNDAPMPQSAYDDANNEDRKRETAEQGVRPAPHVGTVIAVNSGPHRGRKAAVLRVISYPELEDRVRRTAGVDNADYIVPEEVEVSFRGDARDGERTVLTLSEIDWELVPTGFAGRGAISGSL